MEDIEHDSKRVASPSPPPPSSSSPPLLWSCGLFAVAERLDCVLMLLGSIGACIHGAAPPVFFVLVGQMIDSLGSFSSNHRLLSSRISQVLNIHILLPFNIYLRNALWVLDTSILPFYNDFRFIFFMLVNAHFMSLVYRSHYTTLKITKYKILRKF